MKEIKQLFFVVLFFFGIIVHFFGQNNAGIEKTLIITGLETGHNVFSLHLSNNNDHDYNNRDFTGVGTHPYFENRTLNNGIATIPLMVISDYIGWSGSGSYYVFVTFMDRAGYGYHYVSKNKIFFETAITELALEKDFDFIVRSNPQ